MAVTYQWDSLRRLLDEGIAEVSRKHWEEIALDKATVPLDTDWNRYLHYESLGAWRVFSARVDGKPVGYICWWIDHHIRYQSTIYATADVFFILPEHRKGMVGYRLFAEAFKALPKPCKVLINEKLHFKDGRVGKLLERLGMKPIEVVYSKYISG
jgi:GNAT superfamily N-acetyltransferase